MFRPCTPFASSRSRSTARLLAGIKPRLRVGSWITEEPSRSKLKQAAKAIRKIVSLAKLKPFFLRNIFPSEGDVQIPGYLSSLKSVAICDTGSTLDTAIPISKRTPRYSAAP